MIKKKLVFRQYIFLCVISNSFNSVYFCTNHVLNIDQSKEEGTMKDSSLSQHP